MEGGELSVHSEVVLMYFEPPNTMVIDEATAGRSPTNNWVIGDTKTGLFLVQNADNGPNVITAAS